MDNIFENSFNLDIELNCKKFTENCINFISSYQEKLNRDGVVIGLSGGLDSAVIVKLCVLAVGKKNVKVLILPEKDSNKLNIQDALNYAKLLGVKYKKINITPFEKKFRLYHSFILNCIPLLRSQRNRLTEKMNAYYEKKTPPQAPNCNTQLLGS